MSDELKTWFDDKTYLMNILSDMGVDIVEIVRCKDCKWWTILPPDKQFINGRVYGTCYKWSAMAQDDICTQKHYYCNYGERGNDETD